MDPDEIDFFQPFLREVVMLAIKRCRSADTSWDGEHDPSANPNRVKTGFKKSAVLAAMLDIARRNAETKYPFRSRVWDFIPPAEQEKLVAPFLDFAADDPKPCKPPGAASEN